MYNGVEMKCTIDLLEKMFEDNSNDLYMSDKGHVILRKLKDYDSKHMITGSDLSSSIDDRNFVGK